MDPYGGAFTISTTITLFNTYFYIFNEISWWLEENSTTMWKEDKRALKAVRSYVVRNKHHGSTYSPSNIISSRKRLTILVNKEAKLPQHIHVKISQLRQSKTQWMRAPGAYEAERGAMVDSQCQSAGYIAGFESGGDNFTFEEQEGESWYQESHQQSYRDDYQNGYRDEYQNGYRDEYQNGYRNDYQGGYQDDYQDGYQNGHQGDYQGSYQGGYGGGYEGGYEGGYQGDYRGDYQDGCDDGSDDGSDDEGEGDE